LGRPAEAVAHLQKAAALGNSPEIRVGHGQALHAAGRFKEAANALRDLLGESIEMPARLCEPPQLSTIRQATVAQQGTVLGVTLVTLGDALAADNRPEERLVVDEIRACLGELTADRIAA